MAYKKYIKRGEKIYGPYIYHSKRIGNKVITQYVGRSGRKKSHAPPEIKKKPLSFLKKHYVLTEKKDPVSFLKQHYMPLVFGGIVLLLAILIGFFTLQPTARVSLEISPATGENIQGFLSLNLREGELIPAETIVQVSLGSQQKEIPLSQLVALETSEGNFFLENIALSGSGQGYGFSGSKEIYPEIFFTMILEQESLPEEDATETEEPPVPEEDVPSAPEALPPEPVPDAESESPETQPEQPSPESGGAEIPETLSQDASPPEIPQAPPESEAQPPISAQAGITGSVIEEPLIVKGSVSALRDFIYQNQGYLLSSFENVKTSTRELSPEVLNVEESESEIIVSTAYTEKEEGFGEEYLGTGKAVQIPLDQLELAQEEGVLQISFIYNNDILVEASQEIILREETPLNETNVTLPPNNVSLPVNETNITLPPEIPENMTQNITEPLNVTLPMNETEMNETEMNTTQNITVVNVSFTERLEIGKPVKWIKKIRSQGEGKIEIPKEAEKIKVKKFTGRGITGEVIYEEGKFSLALFLRRLFSFFTGRAIEEIPAEVIDQEERREIILAQEGEYEIEYETPAPEATEEIISEYKKKIVVSGPDLGYKNILTYTTLPEILPVGKESAVKVYWVEQGTYEAFTVSDKDENGFLDYVEWNTPSLSNQTFEISIVILNVQSYPTVGGNWAVAFNTTGVADLKIRASNGTNWTNFAEEGHDLRFLEVKCGDDILQAEFVQETPDCQTETCYLLIQNYSCNAEGLEVSKVLTGGKHTLKFEFGNETAYAYNLACDFTTTECMWLASHNTVYCLNNHLVNTTGTCFPVNASNVTFDGQGFSLNFSAGSGTFGVNLIGSNGTIVMNLLLREGGTSTGKRGIRITRGHNNTLLNNTITVNLTSSIGIFLDTGSTQNNITLNNITVLSRSTGGSTDALQLSGAHLNIINSNLINILKEADNSAGSDGIDLVGSSSNNSFFDNQILIKSRNSAGYRLSSSGTRGNTFVNESILVNGNESSFGLSLSSSVSTNNNTFTRVMIVSNVTNGHAINITGGNNNLSIIDSQINASHASAFDLNLDGSGILNLTNTTLMNGDISFFPASTISVFASWYVDANASFTSGGPAEGANISGYNRSNAWFFSQLTNATGKINRTTLLEYMKNQSGSFFQTPYNITGVLGSEVKNVTLNLTNSTEVNFTFQPAGCIDLDSPATFGSSIKEVSNGGIPDYYVNNHTTLCKKRYEKNDQPAANGVLIMNASHIILDCNASVVSKSGSLGLGYAISSTNQTNITFTSCFITQFSVGVRMLNTSNHTLSFLSINATQGDFGIHVINSTNTTIQSVNITALGINNPSGGSCIKIVDSSFTTITKALLSECNDSGIFVEGIAARSNYTIVRSSIIQTTKNQNGAIRFLNAPSNLVEDTNISNSTRGLVTECSDTKTSDTVLRNLFVNGSSEQGIQIRKFCTNTTLSKVVVVNSTEIGIYIQSSKVTLTESRIETTLSTSAPDGGVIIDGRSPNVFQLAEVLINDTTIINHSLSGIRVRTANVTLINVRSYNSSKNAEFDTSGSSIAVDSYFNDSNTQNTDVDISREGTNTTNITFVNTTFTSSSVNGGTQFTVKWWLETYVNYTNSSNAPGAVIQGWDKNNVQSFSEVTGNDGRIPRQNVTGFIKLGNAKIDLNNYTFNATNPTNGQKLTQSWNMTQSRFLVFTLTFPGEDDCGILDVPHKIYALQKNISSPGTCFTITANNITLNCSGYEINYSYASVGTGVLIQKANLTLVKDCIVREGALVGSSSAIFIDTANHSRITNNTLLTSGGASTSITLNSRSDNATISGNRIFTSGNDGYGISLTSNNYANISGNNISTLGSSAFGVYISSSSQFNRIFRNNITTNGTGANGIFILTSSYNNITNNILQISGGGGANGIRLTTSASSNQIWHNTLKLFGTGSTFSFGGIWIDLAGSVSNSLWNNSITSYGDNFIGIFLTSPTSNVSGNIIVTNGSSAHGIGLQSGANFNILRNNTITTSGSGARGIYLQSTSDNNNASNNRIFTNGSSSHAISLEAGSDTNLIFNNLVNTSGTSAHGTLLDSSVSNTISTNNIATSNEGIRLQTNSNSNKLINNTIRSGSSGINAPDLTSALEISNNTLISGGFGIAFAQTSHSRITGNRINVSSGSDGAGIRLYSNSNNNTLINNTLFTSFSLGRGIDLTTNADNNTIISHNITTFGSDGYGIAIRSGSRNNTFTNISITTSGSGARGIWFESASTLIKLTNIYVKTSAADAQALRIQDGNHNFTINDSVLNAASTFDFYVNNLVIGGEWNFTNVSGSAGGIDRQWDAGAGGTLNVHWYLDAYANYTNSSNATNSNIKAFVLSSVTPKV